MKKILFLFLIIPIFSPFHLKAEDSEYSPLSCKSFKNNDKVPFTKEEVKKIVITTGIDPRSICNFMTLGSNTYSDLSFLKNSLLKKEGDLKAYLNAHILFNPDPQFFQNLAQFLFSSKYKDYDQVINSLVLNDLLYGYKVGDTNPIYMEIFLFYSAVNNKDAVEKDTLFKIIPYILSIEKGLLQKADFNQENLANYTKSITDKLKTEQKNTQEKQQSSQMPPAQ